MFRELHPRIDVWPDTSEQLLDFERQEVEIVVGRLRAAGPGWVEKTPFDDYLTAVICRDLSDSFFGLNDLVGQVLLHDERCDNWLVRKHPQNLPVIEAAASLRFSDPGLALDATKAGHGEGLVSDVLALEELSAGALLAPFGHRLHLPDEYRIAHSKALANEPPLAAFVAFVRAEALQYHEDLVNYRARYTWRDSPPGSKPSFAVDRSGA